MDKKKLLSDLDALLTGGKKEKKPEVVTVDPAKKTEGFFSTLQGALQKVVTKAVNQPVLPWTNITPKKIATGEYGAGKNLIKMGEDYTLYQKRQISKDEYIKRSNENAMPIVGSVGSPTKTTVSQLAKTGKLSRIHVDDLYSMSDFIDAVRLGNGKIPQDIMLDATRIAEHYKLPMPKTVSGLANVFDKVLSIEHKRFTK